MFSSRSAEIKAQMNRHLLIELCSDLEMVIANTWMDQPEENKVTCYNIGHKPMDKISWEAHAEIDFFLCPRCWQHALVDIKSERSVALATHHFLLLGKANVQVQAVSTQSKKLSLIHI